MVANYRCNEVKLDATELVQVEIDLLRGQSEDSLLDDFQGKCNKILKQSVSFFETNAGQYSGKVYDKISKELVATLIQQLFLCFDSQLKLLRQHIFAEFG